MDAQEISVKLLLAAVFSALPKSAYSCAVCFGGFDGKSGLAKGFWWGIVVLLVVTMSLVAGIGWTLWTVERRRNSGEA